MPSMANLTLLNKAGSNVTATALTPSAGDSVAARWRIELTTFPPALRPTLEVSCKPTKTSGQRQVEWRMRAPRPYQDASTGLFSGDGYIDMRNTLFVPQNIDSTYVEDAVAYFTSALRTALGISIMETQIAPT